jgi:excisionase family DNA binding protein
MQRSVIDKMRERLSSQSVRDATDTPGLEPAYSVQQLVRHYGNSESFWRKEISRNKIRIIKLGANTRIPKSALDEYLRGRERAS